MKYALIALALVGALFVGACAPFGTDPTPTPDVAALETQAAAVRAVNDARATLNAGFPPTDPPASTTARAIVTTTARSAATATMIVLRAEYQATQSAGETEEAVAVATLRALAFTATPIP